MITTGGKTNEHSKEVNNGEYGNEDKLMRKVFESE